MKERVTHDLTHWDSIRDHRTGSSGDRDTASWLAAEIRAAGPSPEIREFDFPVRLPGDCHVTGGVRRASGVPAFDGGTTGGDGVSGSLGELGSDHPIGLAFYEPFAGDPDTRALLQARAANGHKAIVAVASGKAVEPGLTLVNADDFRAPFGPPVLQVATEHGPWLRELAAAGATVTVSAPMATQRRRVSNVQTHIRGTNLELAPVVVMTPRSAWWTCTSERGGGITVWLQAIRRWAAAPPERSLLFTANTGHELGHAGLEHFLASEPQLARDAHAWVHLGANFAAAGGRVLYQASDAALMSLGMDAFADAGAEVPDTTPVGRRPLGEARNVFDGGGRYVSLLGSNRLFHHPDDRWPEAVDLARTIRLTTAMLSVIASLVTA